MLRLFLQKLRLDPEAYLQLRLARLHVRRVLPRQGFLRAGILYTFNRFFIQNNTKTSGQFYKMINSLVTLPKQFIKNAKMPVCKQCSFFIPHTVAKHKYDLGLCKKFGEKNILSGEIKYFLASVNRNDTNRCGLSGIYYEKQ